VYNYEELRQLGIKPEFLMAVLEVFENPESFEPAKFSQFGLDTIIDYLRKTHTYYLKKKLLEIEQSIHLLAGAYEQAHPLLILLHHFYSDYQQHLRKHIEEEETKLIPYIEQLTLAEQKSQPLPAPSLLIADFISQHYDTEKDLEEIRKTILHYSPPPGNETLYRILVSQLHVLEKDLAVHALMEDEVLLPRACALEERVLGRK
jgi:regulator of cell morphogenesis and NO signaling